MSESIDKLAKNLAGGMSRRKAILQFIGGLGFLAAFTGRKAYAGTFSQCDAFCEGQAFLYFEHCMKSQPAVQQASTDPEFYCETQALIFVDLCIAASANCKNGSCAQMNQVGFNSTNLSLSTNVQQTPYLCIPVYAQRG